jgi:hypothetical protein
MSQESHQDPSRRLLHALDVGKYQPTPAKDPHSDLGQLPGKETTMNAKAPKLRVAAAGLLAGVGLSLLGSLAPAVASANPYVPFSGPLHPIRHYAADVLHPIYSITHPIRSIIP